MCTQSQEPGIAESRVQTFIRQVGKYLSSIIFRSQEFGIAECRVWCPGMYVQSQNAFLGHHTSWLLRKMRKVVSTECRALQSADIAPKHAEMAKLPFSVSTLLS